MGAEAAGRLVVCPTPIGNLEDVTLRVLDVLREADVVACEDTRRTRVLLDRHGIRAAELVALHEHNEAARAPGLVARVLAGAVVAVCSDAGMPVVSDPGAVVVGAALEAGARVEVLPGASSVPVALVASGMGPPRGASAASSRAGGPSWRPRSRATETTVGFESPRRVAASLAVLASVDGGRRVALARELTKVHEEVVRGTAAELAERVGEGEVRGEVVLVVAGADAAAGDEAAAVDALARLVDAGARTRPAAAVVAELTGVSANALYRALTSRDS